MKYCTGSTEIAASNFRAICMLRFLEN
jgi:hypothetical protein